MSQQELECASKCSAKEMTAIMLERLLLMLPKAEQQCQLKLKFAKHVWNNYKIETRNKKTPSGRPKAGRKRKRTSTCIEAKNKTSLKVSKRSPPVPRSCKAKIARFQYGGPDARVGGKYRDMVTLETPCLESTCANCWKWHAHLMCSPTTPDMSLDGSADATLSSLSPTDYARPLALCTDGNVERQRPTRLRFTSTTGKAKFKALVYEQEKKETDRRRDYLRRLQEVLVQDIHKHLTEGDVEAKPRRRHRLKLVFKTKQQKADYRRLVERHLQ
ncbi:hypothetical protein OPT61_g8685 [Boeremia exigua]|uniref:Uncharacterized protein n=1 Tax=Boeremia exigua TaxID=749465 RepID=A0ACC2HX86_9PLEO|nr:hypothetical protein OPT61_g8685 [Boeremia exigua]